MARKSGAFLSTAIFAASNQASRYSVRLWWQGTSWRLQSPEGVSGAGGYDGEAAGVVLNAFDLLMFRARSCDGRSRSDAAACLKGANAEVYGVINPMNGLPSIAKLGGDHANHARLARRCDLASGDR
jgi:hypothetical protein